MTHVHKVGLRYEQRMVAYKYNDARKCLLVVATSTHEASHAVIIKGVAMDTTMMLE